MGTLTPNASIIYESPDGGETVYGRYHGTTEKFLVGYSSKKQQQLKDVEETKIWLEIFNLAKTDEQLQKELDRVKMFYYLRKNDG